MIPIFDLDDTLYDESTFVESGIRAVADWMSQERGISQKECFKKMMLVLEREGRGKVFDQILGNYGVNSKAMVSKCIKIYRHHTPKIELYPEAVELLDGLAGKRIYLVTDGHKIVQANKVTALGLWAKFEKVFITHRYGIKNMKPSLHCFQIIKEREKCYWNDLVYVGDNPAKDFVSLNQKGAHTVRLIKGHHRHVTAKYGFDAEQHIDELREFSELKFAL